MKANLINNVIQALETKDLEAYAQAKAAWFAYLDTLDACERREACLVASKVAEAYGYFSF